MKNFRDSWSNKILHLSSFINKKKNELILESGWSAFVVVLVIISAEILLLVVSLPSYLVAQSSDIRGEHGEAKQYKLRRALTLGTIATLLIIWIIKLLLILFLVWHTNTYGPVKINETQNNKNQNAILNTAAHDMLVADVDAKLPPPHIAVVESKHSQIALTGTAQNGSGVIVLFSETGIRANLPPKIYTTWADSAGAFNLREDSSVFSLPPGNYSVSAITYDQVHKTKSATSTTFSFTVKQTFLDRFVYSFDVFLNILALIAIITSLLVTILVS